MELSDANEEMVEKIDFGTSSIVSSSSHITGGSTATSLQGGVGVPGQSVGTQTDQSRGEGEDEAGPWPTSRFAENLPLRQPLSTVMEARFNGSVGASSTAMESLTSKNLLEAKRDECVGQLEEKKWMLEDVANNTQMIRDFLGNVRYSREDNRRIGEDGEKEVERIKGKNLQLKKENCALKAKNSRQLTGRDGSKAPYFIHHSHISTDSPPLPTPVLEPQVEAEGNATESHFLHGQTLMKKEERSAGGDETSIPGEELAIELFLAEANTDEYARWDRQRLQNYWERQLQMINYLVEKTTNLRQENDRVREKVEHLKESEEVKRMQMENRELNLENVGLHCEMRSANAERIEKAYGEIWADCALKYAEESFDELDIAAGPSEQRWAVLYTHPDFEHCRHIVDAAPELDKAKWPTEEERAGQFAQIVKGILAKGLDGHNCPVSSLELIIPASYTPSERAMLRAVCAFLPIQWEEQGGPRASGTWWKRIRLGDGWGNEQEKKEGAVADSILCSNLFQACRTPISSILQQQQQQKFCY